MLRRLKFAAVWVVIFWVVAAIGLVIYGVYLGNLTPGARGKFNAAYAQLIEDAQPGTATMPNAWPEFEIAVHRLELSREAVILIDKPDGWSFDLAWPIEIDEITRPEARDVDIPLFETAIAIHDGFEVVEALDKVTLGARFVRPGSEAPAFGEFNDDLKPLRQLARYCRARMFVAARDGNRQHLLSAASHLAALARVGFAMPEATNKLIGAACAAMLANCVREHASAACLTPDDLRTLSMILDSTGAARASELAFDAERLAFLDVMEWAYSDDGHGDGQILPNMFLHEGDKGWRPPGTREAKIAQAIGAAMSWSYPSKKTALDQWANAERELRTYLGRSLRDRAALPRPSGAFSDEELKKVLFNHLLKPMEQLFIAFDRCDMGRDAAKLALVIERHRRRTGAYPATLADLGPGLAEAKLDPRWASELRYRPFRDREPRSARPYLLYWIGVDGNDDGGLLNPRDNDLMFVKTPPVGDFWFDPPETP